MTGEFSRDKALKMAELAAGLYELDHIYAQLKLAQDKKDLREIQEIWASKENPDLELLKNNIRFWREKAEMSGGTRRNRGGRKSFRKKNRGRKTRKQ